MSVKEQNVITAETQIAETGLTRRDAGVRTLDAGKIRTGAGCRIRLLAAASKRTADRGRIRTGAGCRIRLLVTG